jgi:uncharacterized membrane protein
LKLNPLEAAMSDKLIYVLNFLALLGTGLVAGVFLTFSSFVMAALGRLPPANGISAMQMINVTVINPLFMTVLFGSAILCIILAYAAFRAGLTPHNMILLVGAALYVIGAILVTMIFNVPLNDALAAVDPTDANSLKLWNDYLRNWTFWNHVRGLAAFAACAAFVRAISMSQT